MTIIAKSVGKVFEENWKKSVPDNVLCYRPPDAAGSFGMNSGNNGLRFSAHSPCDYFLYDGNNLWTLELKTVAGKSISFERTKGDKGVIHYYQIDSLRKFAQYNNVVSGFIIDFRGSDNTYFVNINDWEKLADSTEKKSLNETDILKVINPIKINKKKLKVNYKYDVATFLSETSNNN